MRLAYIRSKQIHCTICGEYKEKIEFPKIRSKKSFQQYYCSKCIDQESFVSSYSHRRTVSTKPEYSSSELNSKQVINKLLAFISKPESYATGTDRSSEKVQFLVENVRPNLIGNDLINFDLAKQKYDQALKARISGAVPNCPRCSSKMVKRTGKYGQFWGCVHFPRCRGTKQI